MTPENRILFLFGLLAFTVLAGLVWRNTSGRIRSVKNQVRVDFSSLAGAVPGQSGFGSRVTFLQFSGKYCSQCLPTARMWSDLAAKTPGARHIEVDITDRLDLASKYNILQTPTTLVLDRNGYVKSRINGAPKTATLETDLGSYEI